MKKIWMMIILLNFCLSIIFAINHFSPVWSGNGFQHMNIFVTQAQIYNNNLTINDEIAVFDGIYCVGMIKLQSQIDQYVTFVASKDDPGTPAIDGFTNNNPLIFKIWDDDAQIEYSSPYLQVTYETQNSAFYQGETVVLNLNVPVLSPKTLTLTTNIPNSATLIGSGSYMPYTDINVNVLPQNGFHFVNWKKNNNVVSSNAQFAYNMPNENVTLQANIERNSYQVNTSSIPSNIGTLSGAGNYLFEDIVQLSATPPMGYSFIKWTKNGSDSVFTENYSFSMPANNLDCVAYFKLRDYQLSVNLNINAAGSVEGYGIYNYNQTITLQASPNEGYHFVAWKVNDSVLSTNPTYQFLMPANDLNLTAEFAINTHTLTMTANPPQAAQLFGAGVYNYGQQVTFSFIANPGYRFLNWTINNQIVVDIANYMFIINDQDYQVTANFALESYQLSMISEPLSAGICSGDGIYQYTSQVQLSATPLTGYHFSSWILDGNSISNNPDFIFSMPPNNCHLTAFFEKNSRNVNVSTIPQNAGIITGAGTYLYGDNVYLTMQPNPGYRFSHYLIDGVHHIDLADYNFIISDTDVNVIAYFEYENYNLSLISDPLSAGLVNGAGLYHYTENVEISATPFEGYHFSSWKNNAQIVSTTSTYNFTMPPNDYMLEAFFEKNLHTVTINAFPAQGGTMLGAGSYYYGDQVDIQAIANPGYHFVNWTINNQTIVDISPYSFIMNDQNYSIQANFERNPYHLYLEIEPDNAGSVAANAMYLYNEQITLTAVPSSDYRFVHWKKNNQVVSTNSVYSFNMPYEDLNLIAVFIPINYVNLPETFVLLEDTPLTLNFNDYLISSAYDLSYSAQNSQNLNISINNNLVVIQPELDWSGSEVITFNIYENINNRSQNLLSTIDVNCSVLPLNDPPALISPVQPLTINEDESLSTLDLSQYITDADLLYGDHILYDVQTSSNIIASLDQWFLSVQPIANYNGFEEITVIATDDSLSNVSFVIPLTILPVNDTPLINLPESISFDEDSSVFIDLTPYISDIDNMIDELSVSVSQTIHCDVEVNGRSLLIISDENWSGNEIVTISVYDELGITRSQASDQLNIIVNPLNDAPEVIQNLSDITIDEDQPISAINLLNHFTDNDLAYSDQLTFRTNDYYGLNLQIENSLLNISTLQDWNGSHEIEVIAADSHGFEINDYMTITVNPVNDPPILSFPDHFASLEDTPLSLDITPYIYDVDNDLDDLILSFDQNQHLSVSLDNNILTIIPNSNWFGTESISFNLDDQLSYTLSRDNTPQNQKTVNFTFYPLNDAPYLISPIPAITINEDDTYNNMHLLDYFSDYDLVNNDLLRFSSSQHDGLTIQINADQVTITPAPNWFGTHTVTFTAIDDSLAECSATVQISVVNINDAPVLSCPQSFTTCEDVPLSVDFSMYLSDIDNELSELTITALSSQNINVQVDNHTLTFNPSSNWFGNEVITVQVNDSIQRNNMPSRSSAQITINVLPMNDPPLLLSEIPSIVIGEDQVFNSLNLNQYFADNDLLYDDHLSFSSSQHSSFAIQIVDGNVLIVPSVNWSGSEIITFTATDDSLQSLSTSVSFTVSQINDAPFLIQNFSPLTLTEDSFSNTINLNNYFSDYDIAYGDHLTYSSSIFANLNVIFENNQLMAQGLNNWFGQHTLTITATDDSLNFVNAQLLVIVNPVNDAPLLNLPDSIIFDEDTLYNLNIASFLSDVDNNNFSLIVNESPFLNTTVSGLNCQIISQNNWYGTTYLKVIVNEVRTRLSVSDSLQIIIAPVNDAPVINLPESVSFQEDENYVLDLSSYVYDIDNSQLYVSLANSSFLNFSVNDLMLNIQPQLNWSGQTRIFITVSDLQSRLSTLDSLIVNVFPVNDSLVINNYSPLDLNPSLYTQTNYSFEVMASDVDNDSLSYNWLVNNVSQNVNTSSFNIMFQDPGLFEIKVVVSDSLTQRSLIWNVNVSILFSDNPPIMKTQLMNNYPNPFNPETTINYSLKNDNFVKIEIYNIKGQLVKHLINKEMKAGTHYVKWDGTDDHNYQLGSGIYFYRMTSGDYSRTKKMMLVK